MNFIKISLLTVLVCLSQVGFSQNSIQVTVWPAPVSMDTQRSFAVVIPQAVLKEVKTNWLKYTGAGSKGKATELNGELLQTRAVNKSISGTPFNIYSRLIAISEGVRLLVWLDDRSVSTQPNRVQHLAVQKYIYDFAVQEYRKAVDKELRAEQNKQQQLENELAALIKSEEKSAKTVNRNERATERATDAIATNSGDIEKATQKIDDQKGNVERNAGDANAAKGAEKTLSGMEGDKRDLQKQNEKQSRDIDNMNKENREEERSMSAVNDTKVQVSQALEKQKLVVRAVQDKLDNIH